MSAFLNKMMQEPEVEYTAEQLEAEYQKVMALFKKSWQTEKEAADFEALTSVHEFVLEHSNTLLSNSIDSPEVRAIEDSMMIIGDGVPSLEGFGSAFKSIGMFVLNSIKTLILIPIKITGKILGWLASLMGKFSKYLFKKAKASRGGSVGHVMTSKARIGAIQDALYEAIDEGRVSYYFGENDRHFSDRGKVIVVKGDSDTAISPSDGSTNDHFLINMSKMGGTEGLTGLLPVNLGDVTRNILKEIKERGFDEHMRSLIDNLPEVSSTLSKSGDTFMFSATERADSANNKIKELMDEFSKDAVINASGGFDKKVKTLSDELRKDFRALYGSGNTAGWKAAMSILSLSRVGKNSVAADAVYYPPTLNGIFALERGNLNKDESDPSVDIAYKWKPIKDSESSDAFKSNRLEAIGEKLIHGTVVKCGLKSDFEKYNQTYVGDMCGGLKENIEAFEDKLNAVEKELNKFIKTQEELINDKLKGADPETNPAFGLIKLPGQYTTIYPSMLRTYCDVISGVVTRLSTQASNYVQDTDDGINELYDLFVQHPNLYK